MSVRILIGDCTERLRDLADCSVDSVVCDPPYHLTSIVKRFGAADAAPAKVGKTGAYARARGPLHFTAPPAKGSVGGVE